MSTAALAPPALRVGQVLRAFLPEYLRTHALPAPPLKILRRLAACRTGDLGYTFWHCQSCRKNHWTPTPCGDRHCPSCQHARAHAWLEKQRRALLPIRYFHWVFTLPAPLRPLALQNPALIYTLLFQAASATLLQFGQLREKKWNVFAKGSVAGAGAVLNYLGRYTHRVALADGRLRALDPAQQTVSFTYKDYADGDRKKEMTLTGNEFVRRFALHVLPTGFTKIRHYGLLGNNARGKWIPKARAALENSPWRYEPKTLPAPPAALEVKGALACPFCQSRELRALARINGRGAILWSRRPLALKLPPPDTS